MIPARIGPMHGVQPKANAKPSRLKNSCRSKTVSAPVRPSLRILWLARACRGDVADLPFRGVAAVDYLSSFVYRVAFAESFTEAVNSEAYKNFGAKIRQKVAYVNGAGFAQRARTDYEYKGRLIRCDAPEALKSAASADSMETVFIQGVRSAELEGEK